jgi:hypothetical protein
LSIAAPQSAAFFDEIVAHGAVWTIRDAGGFPAPQSTGGGRAMPFWSLESRVQKVIDNAAAYRGFETFRLTLEAFENSWLAGMEKDGLLVGINWAGERAVGYDMTPGEVRARIAAQRD